MVTPPLSPLDGLRRTLSRLRRLAMGDVGALDEVCDDASATLPAIVVAAVSLAMLGVGGWAWWTMSGLPDARAVFVQTVVVGTGFALASWLVWLLVAYMLLSRTARTAIDVGAIVRGAGFACAPLVLALLMVVRPLAFGVGLLALVAWVGVTQLAIQRATGREAGEVTLANLAGFGAWSLVMSLLSTTANQFGQGPFVAESVWEAVTGGHVFIGP